MLLTPISKTSKKYSIDTFADKLLELWNNSRWIVHLMTHTHLLLKQVAMGYNGDRTSNVHRRQDCRNQHFM